MTSDPGHNRRPHAGRGRFVRSLDTAERDAQAAGLRAEGMTFEQIAARMGYGHRSLARRAVERALLATVQAPSEALRELELSRLDVLWRAAWRVMETLRRMEDGHPDWRQILAAIDRLIRISERRARLLGLDAPIRHAGLSLAEIDAEIARLNGEDAA